MKYILQLGRNKIEIESEKLFELQEVARNSDKYFEIYACILSKFPEANFVDNIVRMNIRDMREAKQMMVRGIPKFEIAKKFGVNPGYLTKLLRNFDTV